VTAVVQHRLPHVPHAEPVHEDVVVPDVLHHAAAVRVELQHVTALQDEHMILRQPTLPRQASVQHEMTILPVHRQEILRTNQVDHHLELLLTRVPGDVHVQHLVIVHVSTEPEEVVQRAVHHLLIARNGAGRDDDRVPAGYEHRAESALAHAHQR